MPSAECQEESQLFISRGPYDAREATISSIHDYLSKGIYSCRDIVEAHIARIEALNPTINAIISLNPDALQDADSKDVLLQTGNMTGSLFSIPVLLKDNFDTSTMPTTGGCLALKDCKPTIDAPAVTALRNAGAIILGKTNLHEMALEGLSVSSLGGQTLNPYDCTRTPGGSSGGTGAAIAASFAVFGTGTDTVNSLRSPASANSLFSIRPTRGLVSRRGVMPISHTQDAVGPIARNLDDLAVALTVMAGVGRDDADDATWEIPQEVLGRDYVTALAGGTLRGKRLGLFEGFFNRTASNETDSVNRVIEKTVEALRTAGATVISITDPIYNSAHILSTCDTQRHEYREELTKYLSRPSLHGPHPASFDELYSGRDFLVIPHQYPYIRTAFTASTADASYTNIKSNIAHLTSTIEDTFKTHALDALIYPEQSNLVVKLGSQNQHGRNGITAAVTGFPVVAIPAGFSPATEHAPLGVPVGMEILGLKWTEPDLLNLAKLISEARPVRRPPKLTDTDVGSSGEREEMPKVVPDTISAPPEYPRGVF